MPRWIKVIYGIMFAVEVRLLVEIGVSGDEPAHLSIVVTGAEGQVAMCTFPTITGVERKQEGVW